MRRVTSPFERWSITFRLPLNPKSLFRWVKLLCRTDESLFLNLDAENPFAAEIGHNVDVLRYLIDLIGNLEG